jgi:glutamate racemase
MSDNKPVVFFDSGVGGLPYLKLAAEKLPRESFIYVADRKNYPYGHKSAEVIRGIVLEAVGVIIDRFDPKLITIACNTASVVALDALRARFDLPFIGVVPAIKPAAALTKNRRVGVLATQQTLSNEYIANLIRNFAQDCDVVLIPASDLRDLIEERFFSAPDSEKHKVVAEAAARVKAARVDSVVLACTHFLHVSREFQKILDSATLLIDSRQGVINQLARVLKSRNLEAGSKQQPDRFFLSGPSPLEEHYKKYCGLFGLEYCGVL